MMQVVHIKLKIRISMAKTAFNKKKTLSAEKLDLH
jgi:hypothetical protein